MIVETGGEENDACDFYKISCDDFNKTCITNWYQKMHLRQHTCETLMLQLPSRFLNYLQNGRVQLPNGVECSGTDAVDRRDKTESLSDDDWSDDNDSEDEHRIEKFEDIDEWIMRSIKILGGTAFPKLSWKCPKDATWAAFNKSLKCYLPGDIYLLLKCSSNIADVLDKAIFVKCTDLTLSRLPAPTLVLRKWIDVSPAGEFRCFVIQRRLAGISQRDTTACYPSILKERDFIIQDIHHFYKTIGPKIDLSHYSFDVVRMGPRNILLLDLNVFGLVTDPCLFSYKELQSILEELDNGHPSNNASGRRNEANELEEIEDFGNPVFKFIDNDKMIKFRSDVNAGPTTI